MAPPSHPETELADELALIDMGPLLEGTEQAGNVAVRIDTACRELGFFRITGHGIDPTLLARMDTAARRFFDEPEAAKQQVAMPLAGSAWRGWFPVRGEVTSGVPDRKEGLYVGIEHLQDHARVLNGTPLHGANLFPPGELSPAITAWLDALTPVAAALMRGIAVGLGLPPDWFERNVTADPTVLFRVFHYPALDDNAEAPEWGVGEHTDYGLLTLLAQDTSGGLQVQTPNGTWIDVPAEPGVIVCNIGDMLDKLTEGRYRSTPASCAQPERAQPPLVPTVLRPVVGRHRHSVAARRFTARRRRQPALGLQQREGLDGHVRRVPVGEGCQGVPRPVRRCDGHRAPSRLNQVRRVLISLAIRRPALVSTQRSA